MATYKIHEKHDHLICPYNSFHVVEAYRFQRHLMKCKRFYPEKAFEHCSFNYTHVVPKGEIGHHHKTCPDRARINRDRFKQNNEKDAWSDVLEDEGDTTIESSECWDDDAPAVLKKLGGDGFKPVQPKNKKSERSMVDVEGWLTDHVTSRDADWEPEEEVRLPKTMSRVMASGLTQVTPKPQKTPQVFSKAMAAAGRGQIVNSRSVPQELLALGRPGGLGRGVVITEPPTNGGYSSDSSGISSSSPKTIRLSPPGGSPAGRGRGRASVRANRLQPSPGSGSASGSASSSSTDNDPDTGTVSRENVPVPRGLSRIAASLGQPKTAPLGRGRGRPLQETANGDIQVNGQHNMDPEEKQKLIRKLKKKMSEIQILKKQQEAGKVLDADQLSKISNAEIFRKELETLSAN